MRHKYRFILFVLCFFVAMLLFTKPVYAEDSNDDYKKEIAQFHYSVMNEGGYIACALDVMENEDGTFKLDMVFKENIHGINLGFMTRPSSSSWRQMIWILIAGLPARTCTPSGREPTIPWTSWPLPCPSCLSSKWRRKTKGFTPNMI